MVKPRPPGKDGGGGTLPGRLLLALVAAVALMLLRLPRGSSTGGGGGWLSLITTYTDPYAATPFCSPATGKCGEEADVPSPRTVYSAKSRTQFDMWWEFRAALNRSAEEFAARRTMEEKSGGATTKRPLILLGDSITESYLGTEYGRPQPKFRNVPPILDEIYGAAANGEFDPLVLGVSGDQTQHLLWRLGNGQLLPGYADDPDATFVMLIGTNNLGAGHLPGPAAKGILAAAEYVLENTAGRLVLLEVLPRGDTERVARLCPPRCNLSNGNKPFVSFMPAVKKVNMELRDAKLSLAKKYGDGRLSLVDCGQAFLPEGEESAKKEGNSSKEEEEVNTKLMPDRLHPNAEGHRLLAGCVLECIGGNC